MFKTKRSTVFKIGDKIQTDAGIRTIKGFCTCSTCEEEEVHYAIYLKSGNIYEVWADEVTYATTKQIITERLLNVFATNNKTNT